MDAQTLMEGIRLANRLTQRQVHRAVLKSDGDHDTEMTLELLERVLLLGELVATAAQRGHDGVLAETSDEDVLARRLATELVHGGSSASQVADRLGWGPSDLVVAVVAAPGVAAALREGEGAALAWTRREHDIVLALPVRSSGTAISLRPTLDRHHVSVGPAVPLAEFYDSVALAERVSDLLVEGEGAVFADDNLLEMVTGQAPMALRAVRRKLLSRVEQLPAHVQTELLDTLREWLRWWGHRPSIAAALYIHPQTVSGRITRLKDLLPGDLDDPEVRSELLVLLLADAAKVTGATRSPV